MTVEEAPTLELSRAEIIALIEDRARARFGVSAGILLKHYREGKVNPGEIAEILVLADLLHRDDPIFAAA